jgi:GTP1/Obg family GTP-binding protein
MVSNRSSQRALQKTHPLCRNRVQRSTNAAREALKPSYERTKDRGTYAQTNPEAQKVLALASHIASMSDRQVRERYHELVDKRPGLNALGRFELERIEARLDAEDRDPQLEARERHWQDERIELINSVEELLAKLRSQSV